MITNDKDKDIILTLSIHFSCYFSLFIANNDGALMGLGEPTYPHI